MDGVSFAFILMPSIGAVLTAYFLTDWRLSGAVAAGGFGLLLVLPGAGGALVAYALPVIAGSAVAGLVLLPFLFRVADTTVWGRMTIALIAAIAASFANILLIAGGT